MTSEETDPEGWSCRKTSECAACEQFGLALEEVLPGVRFGGGPGEVGKWPSRHFLQFPLKLARPYDSCFLERCRGSLRSTVRVPRAAPTIRPVFLRATVPLGRFRERLPREFSLSTNEP